MNVLVTGSNGQLGSEIKNLARDFKDLNFFFVARPQLDICNFVEIQKIIAINNITTIINCAAYTAVDKSEQNSALAQDVNEDGVLNLVNALKEVQGKLIHISTDYVFNGNSFLPYKESDKVSPIGVYGNTKRAGELAVIYSTIDAIVIRTSWLYSSYGNNFVKTILSLGSEREELNVISDQVGSPTYARDLARVCLEILYKNKESEISANGKMYHFSNEGIASWYDLAKGIMLLGNINCKINPIETKDYPTLAKRPHFSVLNKAKIKADFKVQIPYWRDSLEECVLKITQK
jgi:dTDP-4-dehydrorhamnose reductase